MTNRHIQKKWNEYFKSELNRGISREQIKKDLVQKGVSEEYINSKLNNYQKNQDAKKIVHLTALAVFIMFILSTPFVVHRPTITGAPVGVGGDIFYVDATNGNDNNDGSSPANAIKTIAKVNTLQLDPGDTVLFKRGEVWRIPFDASLNTKNGDSSGNITYGAYGAGNRPLFLGSVNLSSINNWTNDGGDVWVASYDFDYDVGNIIFNSETLFGSKKENKSNLINQGDFARNSTNKKLYVYSTSNPGVYYSSIEAATSTLDGDMIDAGNYLLIEDIELKYAGGHGLSGSGFHFIIRNCSISFIGGGYQPGAGTVRYGNGIQVSEESNYVLITNNFISQVYDAAITNQAWDCGKNIINTEISYNVIGYSRYGYEFFQAISGCENNQGKTYNISLNHNTFVFAGQGWSDMTGRSLRYGSATYNTSNFNHIDNIFYSSDYAEIGLEGSGDHYNWNGEYPTFDYDLYYNTGTNFIRWENDYYSTVSAFSVAKSQESHGLQANPLFVDPANGDFRPQAGSPACTMSSTGSYVGALPCEGGSSFCGDDNCDLNENCSSCEADCGACVPPNSAPTHSNPILIASDNPINSTDATLNCYNQSTIDADGDSVTNNYRWFRNNSLVGSLTTSSIDPSNTSVGDSWICEIKPYDGIDYGLAKNSSALIIRAVCNNTICEAGENCSSCSADCGVCPVDNNITGCTLSSKSWNENTIMINAYNLSSCFKDPLNTTLTYGVVDSDSITISIGPNGAVNLSPIVDWHGVEHVVFNATSGNRSAKSNNVTLTVNHVAVCDDTVCELGETCSNCEEDCGVCAPSGGGGAGGGGGGPAPVNTTISTSNNSSSNLSNNSSNAVNTGASSGSPKEENKSQNISDNGTLTASNVEAPKTIPGTEEPKVVSEQKFVLFVKDILQFLKENTVLMLTMVIVIISALVVKGRIKKSPFKKQKRSETTTLPQPENKPEEKLEQTQEEAKPKPEVHEKNLTPYILGCLNLGYSYDAIRVSLEHHGVSDENINDFFKELQRQKYAPTIRFAKPVNKPLPPYAREKFISALSVSLKKQLDSGFKIKDIHQMFLNYGYPKDVVKEVIKGI